jgi:hypothetical protein
MLLRIAFAGAYVADSFLLFGLSLTFKAPAAFLAVFRIFMRAQIDFFCHILSLHNKNPMTDFITSFFCCQGIFML